MATIPALPMTGTQLHTALTAINDDVADIAISGVDGLQDALDGKAPLVPPVNPQTGTAYTLVLADNGKTITRSNAAANTVTIPANATLALPINFTVNVWQIGAGVTTVVGASGVTVNGVSGGSVAVSGAHQILALMKTGTNSWSVAGGAA